jgi:hypothetical protein
MLRGIVKARGTIRNDLGRRNGENSRENGESVNGENSPENGESVNGENSRDFGENYSSGTFSTIRVMHAHAVQEIAFLMEVQVTETMALSTA